MKVLLETKKLVIDIKKDKLMRVNRLARQRLAHLRRQVSASRDLDQDQDDQEPDAEPVLEI